MQFWKIWTLAWALALVSLAAADPAYAGSSQVLQQTCEIFLQIWLWIRGAVYTLAAIALGMMSFQASVLGSFSMGRISVWGGALFALSSVPAIVAYLTNGSAILHCHLSGIGGGGAI